MHRVGLTAYYCCGARAADAASVRPICGDTYAQRFMTGEGREVFAAFAHFSAPNASNVTRARIIDDELRKRLALDPGQLIVLIGAGFDSRAYRLGGGRWVELDQPALLQRKEEQLPTAEATVPLQRVAIDFASETLGEKLAPWKGTPNVIVVLEGVSQYLTQDQQRETFAAVREAFPSATLLCDLMSAAFMNRATDRFRTVLRSLGTDFAPQAKAPETTVIACGYGLISRTSIINRARELGAIRIPGIIFHTLLRTLRDGYCVYQFQALD